ncbi:hypothetical protein H261_03228 [Paramagnetospirillum caucaseum]|uniref:Phage tail tube protein, GTA-gp10 n=1 Tax=Paramagnetospirillum caucaseum TaxID=1244869 RepID=M3AEV3_9PROT|nr:GTA-gp10 family protein [Paramagnetospirillum caucaseum]EME71388.1 hypothetical protein H261_03228 [Paramagnetospirillum caucaseum]
MGGNPHRGEVEVPLKGGVVTLRPTWDSIAAIEQACGLGLYNLAHKLASRHISSIDLSVVIAAGATAAGAKMTPQAALAQILETGVNAVYPAVLAFVTNAVTGGEETTQSGEGKAS